MRKPITKTRTDKLYAKVRNKRIYNSRLNKEIKPDKLDYVETFGANEKEKIFIGNKGAIKIIKFGKVWVHLEKLKANPKDYKKYASVRNIFKLTDKEIDAVELKEVA